MLALGEFETEAYKNAGDDMIVWIVFVATTFITQITFLNMLIAIMGDTFARVSEVKDQSALSEKIKILADYVIVVKNSRLDQDKYLFSISPAQLGTDEQSNWEGSVTQMKKALDMITTKMQNNFTKQISSVSGEVINVNARLSTIDDRINDLASNQQLMPTTESVEKTMRRVLEEFHSSQHDQQQNQQQTQKQQLDEQQQQDMENKTEEERKQ